MRCGRVHPTSCPVRRNVNGPEIMNFKAGDLVIRPNGQVAKVMDYFPPNGKIVTESPFEGHWEQFRPEELRLCEDEWNPASP